MNQKTLLTILVIAVIIVAVLVGVWAFQSGKLRAQLAGTTPPVPFEVTSLAIALSGTGGHAGSQCVTRDVSGTVTATVGINQKAPEGGVNLFVQLAAKGTAGDEGKVELKPSNDNDTVLGITIPEGETTGTGEGHAHVSIKYKYDEILGGFPFILEEPVDVGSAYTVSVEAKEGQFTEVASEAGTYRGGSCVP